MKRPLVFPEDVYLTLKFETQHHGDQLNVWGEFGQNLVKSKSFPIQLVTC